MKLQPALSRGMTAGSLLFLVLFASGTYSLWKLQGDPDPDTQRVMDRYSAKIYLTLARIGLVHLWTGMVMGAVSALCVGFLWPRLERHRFLFSLAVFSTLAAVCAWLTARLLIHQPTFFDQFLFAQGGTGRWLQVFLTDELGLRALHGIGIGAVVLAMVGSAHVRSLVPRSLPPTRAQLLFVLSLAVIPLTWILRALWSPPDPEKPEQRPNILWITVDSMRPDHLSCAGYRRETTPHLDRLAERSLHFQNAFVPIGRTLTSWTGTLTSSDPHDHAVRHMFPDPDRHSVPMATLPEVLRQNGYRTGVVSDFAGEMFDMMDFHYDLVDTPPSSDVDVLVERQMLLHFPLSFPFLNHRLGKKVLPVLAYLTINADATALADRALRRMRELADQGPFFLTVFFSTAHSPYASPYPYYQKFTDPDYEGPHRYAYGIRDPRQLREDQLAPTPADKEQVIALYDGALAHVDAAIGEMMEELESWGFLESTLIVVTSDHGEHLFECAGDVDHGRWFRGGDADNRVPLLLHDPTGRLGTGEVEPLVRSTDIMPTLLDHLGMPVPETCRGENLVPCLEGRASWPELELYAETGIWLKAPRSFAAEPNLLIYPYINDMMDADPELDTLCLGPEWDEMVVRAKHRALRDMQYKLIYEPTQDGVQYRLFDVTRDPFNRFDLHTQRPTVLADYRNRLFDWMRWDPLRRLDARAQLVPYFTDFEP